MHSNAPFLSTQRGSRWGLQLGAWLRDERRIICDRLRWSSHPILTRMHQAASTAGEKPKSILRILNSSGTSMCNDARERRGNPKLMKIRPNGCTFSSYYLENSHLDWITEPIQTGAPLLNGSHSAPHRFFHHSNWTLLVQRGPWRVIDPSSPAPLSRGCENLSGTKPDRSRNTLNQYIE